MLGWSGYEDDRPHYAGESLRKKRAIIDEWLARIRPKWVADFGCNTGEFSRMAAEQGAHVVALDADHESIQHLYRTSAPHWHLYPVVAQLDDIGAGRGWAGIEHPGLAQRLHGRFDVVMMLALIHHLVVGASIPLSAIAAFARACTREWVIVELIDETDPQLVTLCAQRQRTSSEFGASRQRAAFVDAGFQVEAEAELSPAKRTLVLLRKVPA
jgi:SAM-dependent methyltransferase